MNNERLKKTNEEIILKILMTPTNVFNEKSTENATELIQNLYGHCKKKKRKLKITLLNVYIKWKFSQRFVKFFRLCIYAILSCVDLDFSVNILIIGTEFNIFTTASILSS